MKTKAIITYPSGTWVRCLNNDKIRFVSRHSTKRHFEDDGQLSGLSASPRCKFEHYTPFIAI